MCCGSRMADSTSIRISSPRRARSGAPVPPPVAATDPAPLTVTDDVLFRWARIVRIAKMFPVMHAIRSLEQKLRHWCRGCKGGNQLPEVDRTALADARRQLAECPDERARAVKEAAGILRYRVRYHDLAGTAREIVR